MRPGSRCARYCTAARGWGTRLGADAGAQDVLPALGGYGFEPRREGDAVVLDNCPFHTLARVHTQTVCGMNLHLLRGLLDGPGGAGFEARLAPEPGRCCVRLQSAV